MSMFDYSPVHPHQNGKSPNKCTSSSSWIMQSNSWSSFDPFPAATFLWICIFLCKLVRHPPFLPENDLLPEIFLIEFSHSQITTHLITILLVILYLSSLFLSLPLSIYVYIWIPKTISINLAIWKISERWPSPHIKHQAGSDISRSGQIVRDNS